VAGSFVADVAAGFRRYPDRRAVARHAAVTVIRHCSFNSPRSGTFKRFSGAVCGMSGRPLDVLEEALEETVTVRLKDGEEYHGVLAGYDQHMNLVLEAATPLEPDEATMGELDLTSIEDTTVIRGDNVVTIRT